MANDQQKINVFNKTKGRGLSCAKINYTAFG